MIINSYKSSNSRLSIIMMTIVIVAIMFFAAEVSASAYIIDWSGAATNGWKNPLGEGAELITRPDYDFDSLIYRNNQAKRHAGVDIHHLESQPVYAIAAGHVVKVDRSNDPIKMVVIIKHEGWDNGTKKSFFAIYGHILADDLVKEGGTVVAGQRIGEIRQAGSPSHLHFGINTSSKLSDFLKTVSSGQLGWGRIPSDTDPSKIGWVDPTAYLSLLRLDAVEEYKINVVLVVDVSSSMSERWEGGVKIDSARQAALSLLDLLEAEHALPDRHYQVSVVEFASSASLLQSPTSDFNRLRDAVASLRASGNTNIGDGLEKAFLQLDAANYDRAFVILLSDGRTNRGRAPKEVIRWLEEQIASVDHPVPVDLQASLYGADYSRADPKDRVDTTGNAAAAQILLEDAGYQANVYLNKTMEVALHNLPQDAVFFFGGHANNDRIAFLDKDNNINRLFSSDVRPLILNDLFLAVLAGCKTAADVTSQDNILRAFIDSGTKVGTGFADTVGTNAATHWRYRFWETLVEGATVKEAAMAGAGYSYFQIEGGSVKKLSPGVIIYYPVHMAEQLRLVDLETLPARTIEDDMPPRVYTVGFGNPGNLDEELLFSIARLTGGEYYYGAQADALENIFLKTQHQGTGNLKAEFEGNILQGQETEAGRFTLHRGEPELRVTLNWPGSNLELRLYDPQGRLVDRNYRGVKIWRTERPVYIVIENPRAGEWRTELYGREVPEAGTTYYVAVSTGDIVSTQAGALEFLLVMAALTLFGIIFTPRLIGRHVTRKGRSAA